MGSCEKFKDWIDKRHNEVVNKIVEELKKTNEFDVYTEMRCVGYERRMPSDNNIDDDNNDSDSDTAVVAPSNTDDDDEDIDNGVNDLAVDETVSVSRRIDIVAIPKNRSCIYLIDPTIRIESNEAAVQKALEDKKKTYKPTIRWFQEQFPGISDVRVHGVWLGSRGAHHPSTISLFRELKILKGNSRVLLDTITKIILSNSTGIMRTHLSGTNNGNAPTDFNNVSA